MLLAPHPASLHGTATHGDGRHVERSTLHQPLVSPSLCCPKKCYPHHFPLLQVLVYYASDARLWPWAPGNHTKAVGQGLSVRDLGWVLQAMWVSLKRRALPARAVFASRWRLLRCCDSVPAWQCRSPAASRACRTCVRTCCVLGAMPGTTRHMLWSPDRTGYPCAARAHAWQCNSKTPGGGRSSPRAAGLGCGISARRTSRTPTFTTRWRGGLGASGWSAPTCAPCRQVGRRQRCGKTRVVRLGCLTARQSKQVCLAISCPGQHKMPILIVLWI